MYSALMESAESRGEIEPTTGLEPVTPYLGIAIPGHYGIVPRSGHYGPDAASSIPPLPGQSRAKQRLYSGSSAARVRSVPRRLRRARTWRAAGYEKDDARELAEIAKDHPDWTGGEVVAWFDYELLQAARSVE